MFMQVLDAFLEQLSDQTTLDSLRSSGGYGMLAGQLTTLVSLEHIFRVGQALIPHALQGKPMPF